MDLLSRQFRCLLITPVAFFGLTLDLLLTRVVLPEKDRPIFLKLMREKLGLGSGKEQIVEHLK